MMRVAVVDYGTGNLGSMRVDRGPRASLATDPDQLAGADRLILPGVGNFSDCMAALAAGDWIAPLVKVARGGRVPLLGVCVGMQLLAATGDEGAVDPSGTPGLGLVPGRVRHLRDLGCNERLPHVGWNGIAPTGAAGRPADPLLAGIPAGTNFYFVHSYAMVPDDPAHLVATCRHGVPFAAAVRAGTVWGTQFHPEKSSRAGFRLLRNFIGRD
jgi:glutamine amidotransferase